MTAEEICNETPDAEGGGGDERRHDGERDRNYGDAPARNEPGTAFGCLELGAGDDRRPLVRVDALEGGHEQLESLAHRRDPSGHFVASVFERSCCNAVRPACRVAPTVPALMLSASAIAPCSRSA